ncbi:MAG: leucyl aminopeptidase [Acidiferrobacterales bacterium]
MTIPNTEIELVTGALTDQQCDLLVLAVFDKRKLSPTAQKIDAACDGKLTSLLDQGELDGKKASTVLIPEITGIKAKRVLLIGCGKQAEFGPAEYLEVCNKAVNQSRRSNIKHVILTLPELESQDHDQGKYNPDWHLEQAIIATYNALYRFDALKTEKKKNTSQPARIGFSFDKTLDPQSAQTALTRGVAIGRGISLARELGNMPGNICNPTYLADQALALAKTLPITTTVLEEAEMEKLGMGALLSVSRGSRQPAKLIVMEYKGGKKSEQPVVLVGKGLTFDAGGISLKPAGAMDEMKFDMCGSASVFGTVQAMAEMKCPINLVGIIPSSENMPDGDANKPGDVVTSMSGQTIEILNTDAEGRLILCDALTYAAKFKPAVIIDIATLTGAVVVALGSQATGLLGNDESLIQDLLQAGQITRDRAWQLPLWEAYQSQLDSNFADMANIGGREAGTITAACFLSRYTRDYNWAHLDIAGTAWKKGKLKGATGRPVQLLSQYLITRAKNQT